MKRLRKIGKALGLPTVLRPFRGAITWGRQRGVLPFWVQKFVPWRWALEPYTIYGNGWTCHWSPTEFDSVGHVIFWAGLREWEKETAPIILDNIRQSRCFVDIGANTGIYTIMGCAVNSALRVVAIEPVPKVHAALCRNVSENGLDSRVTVLNVALGETNGTVPFHEAEECTMSSMALDGYHGRRGRVIQVECRTLDSIVETLNLVPDFLKIDVEGFEHIVLSGARRTLDKFRPRIVLEANPGDPTGAMTAILSQYGYRFENITDTGLLAASEIVPVKEYHNWLCIPSSSGSMQLSM